MELNHLIVNLEWKVILTLVNIKDYIEVEKVKQKVEGKAGILGKQRLYFEIHYRVIKEIEAEIIERLIDEINEVKRDIRRKFGDNVNVI